MLLSLVRVIFLVLPLLAIKHEPLCLSRYDYDYKVLRDIVALEQEMKELRKELEAQKDTAAEQKRAIEEFRADDHVTYMTYFGRHFDRFKSHNKNFTLPYSRSCDVVGHDWEMNMWEESFLQTDQRMTGLNKGSGSTYVRWGRTSCPGNGTDLVYTGYSAGSHFQHSGGAANYLCLPSDPLWGDFDDSMQNEGLIYGVEYEISGSYSERFFKKNLGNGDAPCAVCHSSRDSLLFIPGRNACYPGWTLEYSGYLVADRHSHTAASEYVCLDADPEVIPGNGGDTNGKLFYLVESVGGALSCPPYVSGREITCAICTL